MHTDVTDNAHLEAVTAAAELRTQADALARHLEHLSRGSGYSAGERLDALDNARVPFLAAVSAAQATLTAYAWALVDEAGQ